MCVCVSVHEHYQVYGAEKKIIGRLQTEWQRAALKIYFIPSIAYN